MQAIEHTIQAAKAESVEELVDHLEEARAALDDLERVKLVELSSLRTIENLVLLR